MVSTVYCKQRIIELYSSRRISYGRLASILKEEGLKVSKASIWATIQKYKRHGTIACLSGSGRPKKITTEIMKLIESRMKEDDETTATQLMKLLEDRGYKVSKPTIIRARQLLGWTFHGSRYCQMIRGAMENVDNHFEDVVWTDEFVIQMENHRTFSYRKVGEAPKPKAQPKNPYKIMVWAGISKKEQQIFVSSMVR